MSDQYIYLDRSNRNPVPQHFADYEALMEFLLADRRRQSGRHIVIAHPSSTRFPASTRPSSSIPPICGFSPTPTALMSAKPARTSSGCTAITAMTSSTSCCMRDAFHARKTTRPISTPLMRSSSGSPCVCPAATTVRTSRHHDSGGSQLRPLERRPYPLRELRLRAADALAQDAYAYEPTKDWIRSHWNEHIRQRRVPGDKPTYESGDTWLG